MKYFVFSDVHGDYPALMQALHDAEYNPENSDHTLISCGDNFGIGDREKGCAGIFEYLTSSIHKNKPICLRGNHENLILDIIDKGFLDEFDFQCGEDKTLESFMPSLFKGSYSLYYVTSAGNTLKDYGVIDWINSMPYYFKTEHFLFLHSFFPYDATEDKLYVEDFQSAPIELWEKVVWVQTPPLIDKFLSRYPNGIKLPDGKYMGIVFGHWSVAGLHRLYDEKGKSKENIFAPFIHKKAKLIGLDTSTPKTNKVNVLVIED